MKQTDLRFRVFNVLTQEYDRELIPSANISNEGHFFFIPAPEQAIVEQYIGIEDMNGVRMFENDRIITKTGEAEREGVIFKKGPMFMALYKNTSGELVEEFLDITGKAHRVIGTIHDNK